MDATATRDYIFLFLLFFLLNYLDLRVAAIYNSSEMTTQFLELLFEEM